MRRVEDPKARRRDERRRSEMSQEALQSWDGFMMNWKVLRKAEGNWERPRRTGKRSEKLRWVEKSWDELRRAEMSRGNTMSWEELRWAEKCGHVLGRAKTSSSSEGLRWTSKSSRELRCAERSCDKMRRLCTPDSKPYTPQFPLRTLHSTLDSPFYSPLHYSLHPPNSTLHNTMAQEQGRIYQAVDTTCFRKVFCVMCIRVRGLDQFFRMQKKRIQTLREHEWSTRLQGEAGHALEAAAKMGISEREAARPSWYVFVFNPYTRTRIYIYIYIYIYVYIYIYIHIYTTPIWTICISITIR